MPLIVQPDKRLAEINQSHIANRLGKETHVEQVHHGVFGTAGIKVHRQP